MKATFVRAGGDRTADGGYLIKVELKGEDDKAVEVYIQPGSAASHADPALAARIRALRANQAVLYRTQEEGGKSWLTEIRPLPTAPQPVGDITLNGSFVYSNQTYALKAVLKPAGSNVWKATYYFTLDGAKTYIGEVKGSLRDGAVAGTGNGDNRNFMFRGTARGGVITFDHFETTGGKMEHMGNGMLK